MQRILESAWLGVLLVAGALCVPSYAARAADACTPLGAPLVAQAVHVSVITVGKAFDPRGKFAPQFQHTALKGATFAQTCVAHAAGDPLIEVRSTLIRYPNTSALTSAISAATADLISSLKSEGLGVTTSQTTVAGQTARILQAVSPQVYTYTIAATKGTTRYSMSAQAGQPINPSAMKSLLEQLMQL